MVTGYAVLNNNKHRTKLKMDFYLYQGRSGGIYLNIGSASFLLTKKQTEKLHDQIDFYEFVEEFDAQDYQKFYTKEAECLA